MKFTLISKYGQMNSIEISFSVFYILLNKFRGGGGSEGGGDCTLCNGRCFSPTNNNKVCARLS